MKDGRKTKEQLQAELSAMRRRLAELEASEAERKQMEEDQRAINERLTVTALAAREAAEREEALRRETDAQRRFLQSILDNAPVGIAILQAPDFTYEYVNPAYQQFFLPGVQVTGRPLGEGRMTPEELAQSLERMRNVLRTGEPYRDVDRLFHFRPGPGAPIEEIFVTSIDVPLRSAEGQPDRILLLALHTTEQVHARKRVEELAEVAQRRASELQAILENMIDAVYVCDAEGRVILSNKAAVLLSGLTSPEEVEGELAELPERYRVRHLDGRPFASEELPLARALRGEIVMMDDEVFFNQRTQRDLFVRVNAAPIRDEKGNIVGAVSVARDVTDLMELDRLKDQFIEVAAHELKTPVTGIRGYAQFLIQREHEGVSPQGLRALQAINRQTDKISRIINDLLDISRLQAGQLELSVESIDLPAFVKEVVDRMALTTTKHAIRVVTAKPVVVQGDRGRLEQVLINLLDNAIRYSPAGGDVDVAVDVEDHEAVVSVKDNGVGIPKEKQGHIFERFYRAHTGTPYDYGGMGVGLYISNEIVKRHGGRMWFESDEGKGSTFYFSLPMVGPIS